MSTFTNPGGRGEAWNSDWKVVAATAGLVYFAVLLAGAALLGMAREIWLDPLYGRDTAVAIELAVILPFAWYASVFVANGMQLSAGWPAVSIMAITAFLLMAAAYAALAAPPLVETGSLTNQSMVLDIAVQALVAVLPFASRRIRRKPPTTA